MSLSYFYPARIYKVVAIWFVVFSCSSIFAQTTRISVAVDHSGDDAVGARLAYAVREAVRGSHGYRLESADALFRIGIVTLNPDQGNSSNWTVASVVLTMRNDLPLEKGNPQTWYPIYLHSVVQTVGSSRITEQANSVLAKLDAAIEDLKASSRRSLNK
jgi:hypothetical protein